MRVGVTERRLFLCLLAFAICLTVGVQAGLANNTGPVTIINFPTAGANITGNMVTLMCTFNDMGAVTHNVDAAEYYIGQGIGFPVAWGSVGAHAFPAGAPFGTPMVTGAQVNIDMTGKPAGSYNIFVWAKDSGNFVGPWVETNFSLTPTGGTGTMPTGSMTPPTGTMPTGSMTPPSDLTGYVPPGGYPSYTPPVGGYVAPPAAGMNGAPPIGANFGAMDPGAVGAMPPLDLMVMSMGTHNELTWTAPMPTVSYFVIQRNITDISMDMGAPIGGAPGGLPTDPGQMPTGTTGTPPTGFTEPVFHDLVTITASAPGVACTWSDTDVASQGIYNYRIYSVDASGKRGSFSSPPAMLFGSAGNPFFDFDFGAGAIMELYSPPEFMNSPTMPFTIPVSKVLIAGRVEFGATLYVNDVDMSDKLEPAGPYSFYNFEWPTATDLVSGEVTKLEIRAVTSTNDTQTETRYVTYDTQMQFCPPVEKFIDFDAAKWLFMPDGSLNMFIPTGAFTDGLNFRTMPTGGFDFLRDSLFNRPDDWFEPVGDYYDFSATDTAGYEFTDEFQEEIEVDFNYDEHDIPTGATEDDLGAFWFDDGSNTAPASRGKAAGGTWRPVTFSRDKTNNRITARIRHFSLYSVMADSKSPTLTLTSPAVNSYVRGTRTVSPTASDNFGVKTVDLYLYKGTTLKKHLQDGASPFSFSLATTKLPNGTYSLRLIAKDYVGNASTTLKRTVNIDNFKPRVAYLTTWLAAGKGGNVNLKAYEGLPTTVTAVMKVYKGTTLVRALPAKTLSASVAGTAGCIAWNGKNTKGANCAKGKYTVKTSLRDKAGNTAICIGYVTLK